MSKNSVALSPPQFEFYVNQTKYTLFCGGLGSGKTYAGAWWAITMAIKWPSAIGLITANSYKQLTRATLVKVFELLDQNKIPYKYTKNDSVLRIGTAEIHCVSMDNHDDLRGPEYGWAWSDECAFYKKDAFDVLIARLRGPHGPSNNPWKGTTTPNGYNWMHDYFVDSPLKGTKMVTANTLDNLKHLGQDYYDTLRGQFDSKLAEQELDGAFVNLTSGKVYYAFDRNIHCKEMANQHSGTVFVGLDFNVHPLCGIFCSYDGETLSVFDELYLEDSNTFEAAKEIKRRYPGREIKIISDESGNKRSTKSKYTDHQILRNVFGESAVVKFRNPGIKDRYNNTNRMFDHKKVVINKDCKKMVSDLEKLVYDNKDDMLSHISDALGYVMWHLEPLKKPRRPAKIIYY